LVCEAAGYEVVLVETVGVGQSETLVADMTDCFLALMLPGAGDELQGIKRGLLELADFVVVNKADGATKGAAELAARQYASALGAISGDDAPGVYTCSALIGEGVIAVWEAVARRHEKRLASGELSERRRRQNLRWMWSIVDDRLRQALDERVRSLRAQLEEEVLEGALSPEAAAKRVLQALGLAR
jgi:LAO/AO transport system kinase